MMHKSRTLLVAEYNTLITEKIGDVQVQEQLDSNCMSAYQRYVITLPENVDRDKVILRMRDKGIQTAIGTFDLSTQPVFKSQPKLPISEYLGRQTLSLPLYPDLPLDQVERIVNELDIAMAESIK